MPKYGHLLKLIYMMMGLIHGTMRCSWQWKAKVGMCYTAAEAACFMAVLHRSSSLSGGMVVSHRDVPLMLGFGVAELTLYATRTSLSRS